LRKTLTGPEGIRLELDSAEIFPDDPGQGTPAMVYLGNHSATYWWATGEGSLYSNSSEQDRTLTEHAEMSAEQVAR
jgi:hypothetical protein